MITPELPIIPDTNEKEQIQLKKQYNFKLNNSEYNLLIEFYSENIYFRLIEIEENTTISQYIKYNLDINKEFNIDLNKIIEEIDIAFNEGKFKLIKEGNNINILLKMENNKEEIEKKISLIKQELSMKEKFEVIINEIGSVKRKNIEIDEKILKSETILNEVKLNLTSKEKEKISEIEISLKDVKEAINNQRKENENIFKALKDANLKLESKMENLNEEIYEIYKDKLDSIKSKMEKKIPDLKDLYIKFLVNSNEKSILDDKLLIPKDLSKYPELKELKKIVIVNEDNSEEIKSFINNFLIIDYVNSNQQGKYLILKDFKIFEKYYNKVKNKANYFKEIKIIRDFNECMQNIANNKYFIIYEEALKDINLKEKDCIYYFKYKKKPYIFVEKEGKILQLKKDNNYSKNKLFILDEYKIDKFDFQDYIQVEIEKNENINDLEKDNKEFYLINHNWILNKSNEFKPIYCKKSKIFKYLNDFSFIGKENNEDYFNYLISNNLFIQNKDIIITKLFFINFQNNIPENKKHLFIGIFDNDNNSVIYFYYKTKNEKQYNFYFLIQFNDENIMNEEIEKNIKRKGIGKYLYDFGIICSNPGNMDLINIDSKKIGTYVNNICFNNKIYDSYYLSYFNKEIKNIEKSGFLTGFLYCLINIKPLADFFSRINKLLNLIDEKSTIIKLYYKIFQDLLWNSDNKDDNINNLYLEFIQKIKDISKNNDICNNIENLVNILLLELQNNLLEDNKGKKLEKNPLEKNFSEHIYECEKNEKKNVINNIYSKYNSIIRKLFFFELKIINDCNNKKCKQSKISNNFFCFTCNSFLNIDFKTIDEDIRQNEREEIDIDDLIYDTFNKNVHSCLECCSDIIIKRKFYSFPRYLIICINEKRDIRFINKENLNITKYLYNYINNNFLDKNNYEYELISFIIDDKQFYCKSQDNNSWYKYEIAKTPIKIKELDIFLESIPYLLIYKKK